MATTNRYVDYVEKYNEYYRFWNSWLILAHNDLRFSIGDQWTIAEKSRLANLRRHDFVFNRIKPVVKIVTGYQRKNRLAYKVSPNHSAVTQDASIWSDTLQYSMKHAKGYNVMSDAFEQGAIKTGINLVEPYLDYRNDPVNGEMRLRRTPHNLFLLHPSFTERDLSDCPEVLKRAYLSKPVLKTMFPWAASDIEKMQGGEPQGMFGTTSLDGRYPFSNYNENWPFQEDLAYDEHWIRVVNKVYMLLDQATGETFLVDKKSKADEIKREFPQVQIIPRFEQDIQVTMFVNGEEVYHGGDPFGLKDYRFVPVMGYFDSEYDDLSLKLRGLVRDIIDPQREVNRRRSKNIDMQDTQLNNGFFVEEDSVVSKQALYSRGTGKSIFMKKSDRPISDRIQAIPASDIPPGSFQLQEIMDRDLREISGVNDELLGLPGKDAVEIAGVLSKMRQGQALTTLADLFDNYGVSKELLGKKMMGIIRENWDAAHIERITGRRPSQLFFDPALQRYNLSVTEGVLTDSQKQMNYVELVGLKREGIVNVPEAAILEASNLENKEQLAKITSEQAQAAQQGAQVQQQVQVAAIESTKAKAAKDQTAAQENMSKAKLNEIMGISELASIERDDQLADVETAKAIEEMAREDVELASTR